MKGDFHVWFCENVRVKFPCVTRLGTIYKDIKHKQMKAFKSLLFILTLIPISMFGQDFQPPKDYKFEKESDYLKYENDIVKAIEYLENTPIGNNNKRKDALTFITNWIVETPTVSIEISEKIVPFAANNTDLLSAFMGGWTKLVIEHPESKEDLVKCNLEGLLSVIKMYKLNKELKRDKFIDKLVEYNDKGKLNNWIHEQLKK